ncbi:YdcF family protein [Clostridium botulinum]|uniref:YdcF family protein n=1 Tax=Clostridium botulinum TaxID=1491 RepID=UPI001C9B4D99|nr:YdcF family protein [Clostridium botulinum]MBY6811776.1 YdcF family protein [Clostridium botulinum]MBY6825166.1 YdcF family protein [Clostridium botulinum]MBY6835590.1 YdcF family protein [Clostridium botulinum]MBY6974185.1 YdcF family protein [Clostridium botulinum]MCS6105502.1 YdcF family protein [Clostridium botulinum]
MRNIYDIFLGCILIIYVCTVNTLSSSKIAFSLPIFILGIILILYHFIKSRLAFNRYFIKFNKVMRFFICIGLVLFFVVEVVIISCPKSNKENTDYIVVLGAGLNNGDQLSYILKSRLDSALQCINEFKNNSYIIVSGGKGNDERISEAMAMKKYLLEQGISEDKILMEDQSKNTFENFKYSKKLIEEQSNKNIDDLSVKIVTTDFHGFRSKMLAKRNGYNEVKLYTNKTMYYLIPICYTREAFAVVKSIIFDR